MIDFLKRVFSWWHSATLGTSFTLWRRKARLIGMDEQGNRYFEEGGAPSFSDGRRRRWVIYHGVAEASRVPPDWHGWLHHVWDEPPTVAPLPMKKFEKQHLPNMSGTPLAYAPVGSLRRAGGVPEDARAFGAQALDAPAVDGRPKVDQDYEAWSPDDA